MPDYAMVRLQRETIRELKRVKLSMLTADALGLIDLEKPDGTRTSLDAVIRRLIAFRERHAERVRRSKARRRKVRADRAENNAPAESLTEGGVTPPHSRT
jgi:hypothetical protein